jgi:hypothetical protein
MSLRDIAASTLEQIERGDYNVEGRTYDLTRSVEEMKNGTVFFPADSDLSGWRTHVNRRMYRIARWLRLL